MSKDSIDTAQKIASGKYMGYGKLAAQIGMRLKLEVMESPRGYYIGTQTECGEPVSRESNEYFDTEQQAEAALASGLWTQKQNP